MKRFLCVLLSLVVLLTSVVSCSGGGESVQTTAKKTTKKATTKAVTTAGEQPKPEVGLNYATLAAQALDRLYSNFWDAENNRLYPTHAGKVVDAYMSMTWEHCMAFLAMENYYYATKDEATKQKLEGEWQYIKNNFSRERLVGHQGEAPNLAMDDAGWTAMLCIAAYRITGDRYALECAHDVIVNSYDYFKDGELSNGMWYCDKKLYGGDQWKSIYCVSFLVSALDYLELTEDTVDYDEQLWEDTMDLYNWVEENLCRNRVVTFEGGLSNGQDYTIRVVDNLYWCDYNWGRSGRDEAYGPDGGTRPNDIKATGSVSSLFGNTGMAAVHAILYRMTGDMEYLNKCYAVMMGIEKKYINDEGGIISDRDPWTNAALMYYFVKEALTVPEVSPRLLSMVRKTAYLISEFGYTEDNYYHSLWSEYAGSTGDYTCLMQNATTVAMVTAAAYAESLGLFENIEVK